MCKETPCNPITSQIQVVMANSNKKDSISVCQNGITVLFFKGCIYNQEILSSLLFLSFKEITLPQLLIRCYQTYGEAFISKLRGKFAFILRDDKKDSLICGRDQFGLQPFYYHLSSHKLIYATTLNPLIYQIEQLTTDEKYLQEMLSLGLCNEHKNLSNTCYQEIKRIKPAHFLKIDKTGVKQINYWNPEQLPILHFKTNEEYIRKFKRKFQQAVRRAMKPYKKIAIEISGGLDSSSIAAIACKNKRKQSIGLSNTISEPMPNSLKQYETDFSYAKELCQKLNINHFNYESHSYNPQQTIQKYSKQLPHFLECDFTILNTPLIEKAKYLGCEVILSGFGGDQLISQRGHLLLRELKKNKRYLKQLQYYYYHHSYKDLLNKIYKKMLGKKTSAISVSFRQKLKTYLHPSLQNFLDLQLKKRSSFISQRHYTTFFFPSNGQVSGFIGSRVETSALLAEINKIDYAYPMLDVDLVEFCYQCPTEIKNFKGVERYLLRTAMKNEIPSRILNNSDKSGCNTPSQIIALYKSMKYEFENLSDKSTMKKISPYLNINHLIEKKIPLTLAMSAYLKSLVMHHAPKREKKDDVLV